MNIQISDKMQGVSGSMIRELFKLAKDPSIVPFGGGNPSPASFPTAEIAEITARAFAERPVEMLQYGLSEGYTPLRETLKAKLTEQGFDFSQNELMIVSGGQQAADLTAKVLLNEGDVVLSENPSFVGCLNTFRSYNAKLVGVDMQSDGMNIELLEQAMKANPNARFLYTIPSFQNPTGFTTSAAKRKAIYDLACKHNVVIFEDNPYGELRFSGEDIPAIKTMDTEGRVIYAGSFSKVMAPAFRLGFLVIPSQLVAKMTVAKQCTDVHSTVLFQYICNEYMTKYDYAHHITDTRALYKHKADLMLGEMEKKFNPAVTFCRPEGGLFVMAFLPEGQNSMGFVKQGIERGVACVPGAAFLCDGSKTSNGFRLNYSAPTDEQIVRGVTILAQLIEEWI